MQFFMSQSEFDGFSDGLLAQLPDEILSARADPIWHNLSPSRNPSEVTSPMEIDANKASRALGPTLDQGGAESDAELFPGARGGTPSPPVGDRVDNAINDPVPLFLPSSLTLTHVSGTPTQLAMASTYSTPPPVGPIHLVGSTLQLSEASRAVRTRLLAVLRDSQEQHVLDELEEFDDENIKEAVDLVIAGMLENSSAIQTNAQQLQAAIRLLVLRRRIEFSHHARFETLLSGAANRTSRQLAAPAETDEQIVLRVWGAGFREVLNIAPGVNLFGHLSRLAHYSELLNQSPVQIASYLDHYRKIRAAKLESRRVKGRRPANVTGEDVDALNRQLKHLVVNNLHEYSETAVIAPGNLRPEAGDAGLEAFRELVCFRDHRPAADASHRSGFG
jgi:hypothetical protein